MTKTLMEPSLEIVALGKARIDNGLSRLGRRIDSKNPVDCALLLFAARAVASSNAAALLVAHGYEIEASLVLRVLGELAIWMRWIMEKDNTARAGTALREIEEPGWQFHWEKKGSIKRATHLDFEPFLQEALSGFHLARFHSKAGHVPWDHLVHKEFPSALSGAQATRAAALFLAHVLEALNARWPDYFPGAAEIRSKFKDKEALSGGDL